MSLADRPRSLRAGAAALLPALLLLGPAPAGAAGEPAVRRGACQPVAYEREPAAAAASEDDDEEEGGGAAEAGEPQPLGFAYGADGCATVEGTFVAIVTHTDRRFDDARLQARDSQPAWTLQVGGTVTASTAQTVGGLYLGTKVSLIGIAYPVPAGLFAEASVRLDRLYGGYAPSTFIYWGGDLFAGWYLTPSRATALIAFDLIKPKPWSLTVALEDPAVAAASDATPLPAPVLPTAASTATRWPDIVARLRYETDTLGFHAAAALRPGGSSGAGEAGYAFTLGALWSFDLGGVWHTLSGQAMVASDMPRYLGTPFDARTLRSVLRPEDRTTGWSAVASWTQDWTKTVSTGAYVSQVEVSVPGIGARGGTLRLTRAAANLTYKPQPRTSFAVELGLGRTALDLPDRINTLVTGSGSSVSLTLASMVSF